MKPIEQQRSLHLNTISLIFFLSICLSLLTACNDSTMKSPGQIVEPEKELKASEVELITSNGMILKLHKDQILLIGNSDKKIPFATPVHSFNVRLRVTYNNGLVSHSDITHTILNVAKEQVSYDKHHFDSLYFPDPNDLKSSNAIEIPTGEVYTVVGLKTPTSSKLDSMDLKVDELANLFEDMKMLLAKSKQPPKADLYQQVSQWISVQTKSAFTKAKNAPPENQYHALAINDFDMLSLYGAQDVETDTPQYSMFTADIASQYHGNHL